MLKKLKKVAEKVFNKLIDKFIERRAILNRTKIAACFRSMGVNSFIDSPLKYNGLENVSIGNNVFIGHGWRIETFNTELTPNVKIGDNVTIEPYFHLGAVSEIRIGNNVLIASKVYISDHSHGDIDNKDHFQIPPSKRPLFSKGPIHIGNNVWIGENVCILPNVRIGNNSVVGANSVVTRDIPNNSIAAGVPAKILKMINGEI